MLAAIDPVEIMTATMGEDKSLYHAPVGLFIPGSAGEHTDPLLATGIRGNGLKAWFGWPDDPKLEEMREHWLDASDPAEQKKWCEQIQQRCLEQVTVIPVGQYLPPAAWGSKISTPLKGTCPVFWGVSKTA